MNKIFSDISWEQYLYWQVIDKSILKKINALIKDIERNGPATGTGKPELLKFRKAFSRRINSEHRLIYIVENDNLIILACKGHYQY